MRMNEKTDVQVIINDKRYTISGYESSDYLQHIANYINEKLQSFKKQDAYNHLDMDMKNILLAINLSDDYFKARKQGGTLESDIEAKDKEMYDLKHELISAQIKLENAEKELAKMKEENNDLQMQIVKLETEMKNRRR